jgi:hypothetical protein
MNSFLAKLLVGQNRIASRQTPIPSSAKRNAIAVLT